MCLGVPGKVLDTGDSASPMPMGTIDVEGESRPCCFAYVPDVEVGNYVLFQHGFAIDIVAEEDAQATLHTMRSFDMLNQ